VSVEEFDEQPRRICRIGSDRSGRSSPATGERARDGAKVWRIAEAEPRPIRKKRKNKQKTQAAALRAPRKTSLLNRAVVSALEDRAAKKLPDRGCDSGELTRYW